LYNICVLSGLNAIPSIGNPSGSLATCSQAGSPSPPDVDDVDDVDVEEAVLGSLDESSGVVVPLPFVDSVPVPETSSPHPVETENTSGKTMEAIRYDIQ